MSLRSVAGHRHTSFLFMVLALAVLAASILGRRGATVSLPVIERPAGSAAEGSRAAPILLSGGSRSPLIELGQDTFDLGVIPAGDEVGVSTTITNRSPHPVRLLAVARCGCIRTQIHPEAELLNRDAVAELRIAFDSHAAVGPVVERIAVFATNRSGRQRSEVLVRASISGAVRLRLAEPLAQPVLLGTSPVVSLRLSASADIPPFRVSGVTCRLMDEASVPVACPTRVDARWMGDGMRHSDLECVLPRADQPGRVRARLTPTVTASGIAPPPLLVAYEVRPPVYFALRTLFLGTARAGGKTVSARARILAARDDVHFRVVSAEVENPDTRGVDRRFSLEVTEGDTDAEVHVEFRANEWDGGSSVELLARDLIVRTDHDDGGRLVLPIRVWLAAPGARKVR